MDNSNVWELEDDMLPPFMDHVDFQASSIQPSYSFSHDERFDSSFSSSAVSYEECSTPSRSDYFGLSHMDDFSSRASLGSYGSSSPAEIPGLCTKIQVSHMMKHETDYKNNLYLTPCEKSINDQNMMSYDYSPPDDVYRQFEFQDDFSNVPGVLFNNLPELIFDGLSHPLSLSSSPSNLVVPSHTFASEPYRAIKPESSQRAIRGSSIGCSSQRDETIRYFMSPRETKMCTPSSSLSPEPSHSGLEQTPPSKPLHSSIALHRVQSIGTPRISKHSKRTSPSTAKIERVAAGAFHCNYNGCRSNTGFKRLEHLKRHQLTHTAQELVHCEFCPKKFPYDRIDNFKSHLHLHTVNRKGSRTKYFPEAIYVLNLWNKRNKKEHPNKKRGVPAPYRAHLRGVKKAATCKSEPEGMLGDLLASLNVTKARDTRVKREPESII